jgi:hypothetical protein
LEEHGTFDGTITTDNGIIFDFNVDCHNTTAHFRLAVDEETPTDAYPCLGIYIDNVRDHYIEISSLGKDGKNHTITLTPDSGAQPAKDEEAFEECILSIAEVVVGASRIIGEDEGMTGPDNPAVFVFHQFAQLVAERSHYSPFGGENPPQIYYGDVSKAVFVNGKVQDSEELGWCQGCKVTTCANGKEPALGSNDCFGRCGPSVIAGIGNVQLVAVLKIAKSMICTAHATVGRLIIVGTPYG